MKKKNDYLISAILFLVLMIAPFTSRADDIQAMRSEHEQMSQEHKQMKTEHKEMQAILKKISAHISAHEKEMNEHEKEIQHHGKKLQIATTSSPELEAEHKKFKEDHIAEKTEHDAIMSAMKQIEASIIKK
ncbi:MAG: hypothetical protein ACXVLQ_12070 [Bacteriovorax sp.]